MFRGRRVADDLDDSVLPHLVPIGHLDLARSDQMNDAAATDIGEKHNVATGHPERVAELRAKLAGFLKDAVKPGNPD
jgi:hypothetical protein